VTVLCHDAAVLRIGVDSMALFANRDPDYELWLQMVIGAVAETRRKQNEAERRAARA